MKAKHLLFAATLTALLLTTYGCDDDPYPLNLEEFEVQWFDIDHSGSRTPNDELDFHAQVNTTDPDAEDQYIAEWEFTYSVNGQFVGVLQSDTHMHTNGLTFNGTAAIKNLPLPFSGGLLPGDRIEFRFWAADNHGTFVERFYQYELE